ncbi:MAG: NAD-dependent epimerase/dehydratase family protein [Thermodesulfobacteriota bacterium]
MKRALVTGGGGFVGGAVVAALVQRGVDVLVIGRNRYPALEQQGVRCLQGDITDLDFLIDTFAGVDTVFHVAALAGVWGVWQNYYQTNVVGTENVLKACRKTNVARLVYTSTPSVVFDRGDIEGGDESLPYPQSFLCHYAKSKVLAEKAVLAAAGDGLATCAIRPHLVWGPGDPHLIPRLLERGRSGRLKQVGKGHNLVDISYIDNVAHAHLLAADNLEDSGSANGRAYFISQGEPVNLWQWIDELFVQTETPQVRNRISFAAAYRIGQLLEIVYKMMGIRREPLMTRFVAEQLAKSHYFSIDRARRDLGYEPLVTTDEGMKRLLASLKE